ncbi:hypothetical protein SLEP1_g53512 [Rubroshorea leprosula]|uniref:Retrovirus-related Pol polyprotein from transposon TNT 1-94 n=1 Tax=Rubroshorea leprosula TaxID=152421 RepID=A0AAV5M9K5_9ROSI|nr:hypothetical protein SLEP1_g53512 [Rubroshorea leprosula]
MSSSLGQHGGSLSNPPLFTGKNYDVWAIKMKAFLKGNDVWDSVENGFNPPRLPQNPSVAQIKQHAEYVAGSYKALSFIHSAVADEIFPRIMRAETAQAAWEILQKEFEGDERIKGQKIVNLKKEFAMMRMKETDTIHQYSNRLMDVVNQIRLHGEDFPDQRVVEKMIVSLPEKFEPKISAIEESCDLKTLTVYELIGKLQVHEQRTAFRMEDMAACESAFQALPKWKPLTPSSEKKQQYGRADKGKMVATQYQPSKKDKFPPCSICKRTNHDGKDCWYKGKPQVQCRFCRKYGHIEKFCKFKENQYRPKQQQAQVASTTEDHLFMASLASGSVDKCLWFVDSGCTCHMANNEAIFSELDKSVRIKVKLGNGSIVQSEGNGIVAVQTKKGTKYIHDVLFIPSLSQNLLSVAQMLRKGYSVSFANNACYIYDSCGVKLARIKMVENSFPITWNSPCLHAVYVSKSDETSLWHKRYGHFNLKSLKFLQTNELVRDLPEIHVNDDAVQGKTPIEAWFGVKPSAHHLKIFGSICYTHVPDAKRTKLDVKVEIGILVGYSTKSKGYRVYNLQSGKISVHRDVQVDEDSHWDWDKRVVVKSGDIASVKDDVEASKEEISASNVADVDAHHDSPVMKTKSFSEIYERCNLAVLEPNTYAEASKHDIWRHAMQEEMQMITKNETWELTSLPPEKNAIGVKWVFRTKMNPDGSIHKHKARLVVKGYAQQAGIDYGDTFSPVAQHDTVRMLIALSANFGCTIYHVDVKSAFLNGHLQEDIYVQQPEGFIISGHEDKVYKLKKALYGLKQAPRSWYNRIDSFLLQQGFQRSENEPTLYVKCNSGQSSKDTTFPVENSGSNPFVCDAELLVSLYVDDLLITGSNSQLLLSFKANLMKEFEMSYLGEMSYFLGMEIHQCESGIFVSQHKYALDVLKKFSMDQCKSVPTPLVQNSKLIAEDGYEKTDASIYRSLVGSLLYLTATRPDLMYAASLLSRFMHSPSQARFGVAKRVLRYLNGTSDYGLCFFLDV